MKIFINYIFFYYFSFLDGQVAQFMKCILPKLNGISLFFRHNKIPIWQSLEYFGQIQRLLEMLAGKASSFCDDNLFNFLRSNPNAYTLIENIQSIKEIKLYDEEDIDLLIKWLIKSRNDKKPKSLKFAMGNSSSISMLINKIKEVNWIIFYLIFIYFFSNSLVQLSLPIS